MPSQGSMGVGVGGGVVSGTGGGVGVRVVYEWVAEC